MRMQIAPPGGHVVLEIADPVDDRHAAARLVSIEPAALAPYLTPM
jgi:hypothetical protein